MTIFSIVQADKLSSLFEMTAQALRTNSSSPTESSHQNESECVTTTSSSGTGTMTDQEDPSTSTSSKADNYPSLTVPCISFPESRKRHSSSKSHHPNPLYMTVALMADEDPRKRCFHGMLTDYPGTGGSIGLTSPELLSMMCAGYNNNDTACQS